MCECNVPLSAFMNEGGLIKASRLDMSLITEELYTTLFSPRISVQASEIPVGKTTFISTLWSSSCDRKHEKSHSFRTLLYNRRFLSSWKQQIMHTSRSLYDIVLLEGENLKSLGSVVHGYSARRAIAGIMAIIRYAFLVCSTSSSRWLPFHVYQGHWMKHIQLTEQSFNKAFVITSRPCLGS